MFKQVKQVAIALAAMVTMSAPAMAATIIDFRNGATLASGSITFDGTNVIGSNSPIGTVEIFGAPINNGSFTVTGTLANSGAASGTAGDLDFNTRTGVVTLTGCIAQLGVGLTVDGVCTRPVALLSGTLTGFDVNAPRGRVLLEGLDTKSAELLIAIGLSPNTPFVMDTFQLLTGSLNPNGTPASSISTDVRNVAVPEPATMMLLGTGLLAAFRARRRQTA